MLVAFVGRLEFYKGVDTLLEAMARLARTGEPPRVVIAGDGPLRGDVEKFIATSPTGKRVRWLGMVPNVPDVLSAADIYVMPSLWEGWPLALGEAMSASLPAVGSDVPGIRDILLAGKTGLLVGKQDPAALAAALARLCGDAEPRRQMGAAGRERIVERFSIRETVAAHERLYDEIAGHLRED